MGFLLPFQAPEEVSYLFDAPHCLGLQLLTVIPVEGRSKQRAVYRCAGSVRFRAR